MGSEGFRLRDNWEDCRLEFGGRSSSSQWQDICLGLIWGPVLGQGKDQHSESKVWVFVFVSLLCDTEGKREEGREGNYCKSETICNGYNEMWAGRKGGKEGALWWYQWVRRLVVRALHTTPGMQRLVTQPRSCYKSWKSLWLWILAEHPASYHLPARGVHNTLHTRKMTILFTS